MKKWKQTAGFTLVELIVVIAILGILAGVGTVGYSGYIKKANQAADNVLLSAVNTAFSAACLENGVDAVKITDATLAYTTHANGDAAVTSIGSVVLPSGNTTTSDAIKEAFARYFAGNSGTLKYYEQGDIIFYEGVFSGDSTAAMTKAIANYKASNLSGREEELLTSVENITGTFAEFLGEEDKPISNRLAMLASLGVDTTAFAAKYGLTDASSNQAIANALVLESASRAKNIDPYMLYNKIMDTGTIPMDSDLVATLPLAYGLATAYANSDYATEEFKTYYSGADLSAGLDDNEDDTDSLMTLFDKFTADPGLMDYMRDAEKGAITDMNGYLGAMTAISQNTDSVNINSTNAFTNDQIKALVVAILGSGD